jgi:hypothetical protein
LNTSPTLCDISDGRGKQYLARQPSPAHWRDHFGASWERFVARKARAKGFSR